MSNSPLSSVIFAAVCVCLASFVACDSTNPSSTGVGSAGQTEAGSSQETNQEKKQEPSADQGGSGSGKEKKAPADTSPASTAANEEIKWQPLFDGKSTDGWEAIEFGGEGDFFVNDEGALAIGAGDPLTGFSSTLDDLPTTNYEISLQARKTSGIDFFCALTFPVEESHCTLVIGGWAGCTVGLSCIDGKDASENETTKILKFDMDRWYNVRVRVEPNHISAWIDDALVCDVDTEGKEIGLRGDADLFKPLGVCSFMTEAEVKDFKMRLLEPPAESKASGKSATEDSSGEKKNVEDEDTGN